MEIPPLVYEGQVLVTADHGGPDGLFDPNRVGIVVKEVLDNFGSIMAMETTTMTTQSATYRAEFCDSTSVNDVLTHLQDFRIAVSQHILIRGFR